MIIITKIKINISKELYKSIKDSLEKMNEETLSEINSYMTFEEFLIFIIEYYLEREEK